MNENKNNIIEDIIMGLGIIILYPLGFLCLKDTISNANFDSRDDIVFFLFCAFFTGVILIAGTVCVLHFRGYLKMKFRKKR